ncbi:AAA family ATPase [Streptomyces pseudovenezuelae]|uniref:ATP-dependent endonuclease n=1 Tax=Streptomyces pseudovenezuelae TaxID=67350 RepID=UPI0034A0E20E
MDTIYAVKRLQLVDGTVIEPPMDGMTVFTGPNNSGKSMLLRELVTALYTNPGLSEPIRWISGAEFHVGGSSADFISWLSGRGIQPIRHGISGRYYLPGRPLGEQTWLDVESVCAQWDGGAYSPLAHLLVKDQWTEGRLSDQTSSTQWDWSYPAVHPTQLLWESSEAHNNFSGLFEQAFGKRIAINRYQHQIRLQVGSIGMEETAPPPSREVKDAYASLPYLVDQGDGMKAFANLILHTLVRPAPVIVIDEPEAFLHPPQVRLLARYLTQSVPSPCQVFVATHSSDFLSGAMEASAPSQVRDARALALVRINRSAGPPSARTLDAAAVRQILDTPLLRYSNIISGIFHDGVVLCEAEGDCQFYAATLDVVLSGKPNPNLTYLHVNGKARLGDSVEKLRACGVPTAAIADLDFLNDPRKVQQAVNQLGGAWDDIKDDVHAVNRYANSEITAKPAAEVKQEIVQALGSPKGRGILSQEKIEAITKSLKRANGWKHIKESGVRALGDQYMAAQRVIDYLAALGIFLVPEGELERWVRQVPSGNKSAWLTAVFEQGWHEAPSEDLKKFVAAVYAFLTSNTINPEATA